MRLDILKAMNAARRERRGGVIVTRLSEGEQRFVAASAIHGDPLAAELDEALRLGKSGTTAFATPERFPETPVLAKWPDEAFTESPPDRYTAVCLLTHDPKIDDPALKIALRANCFYIGALGSRKTHAKRLERMRAQGFDEAALARIRAPIGLDIGAVSPAEIAVSTIGEIVASLRKKPLRSESAAA